MKDNTKENTPDRNGDDQQDGLLASCTPQQRKTILKGLRILARVAIRSYIREQAEQARDEADEDGGEEGG